jgi:hypothetical protein
MAILFAGTSIAEGASEVTSAIISTTGLPTGVSEAVQVGAIAASFVVSTPSAQSTFWLQFHKGLSDFDGNIVVIRNGASPCIRLVKTSGVMRMESFNGSTWSLIGSTFGGASVGFWDIEVVIGASGVIRAYRGKALEFEFTGNTVFNSVTSADRFAFQYPGTTSHHYSCIIVADEDTRPLRYAQAALSAQGALAEWTGAVGNVSGTGFNDGTLVTTDTPDQRTTYTKAALNALFNSGWTVETAVVSVRAATEPGKAAGLRGMARSSSVDGFSAQQALANPLGVRQFQIPTDPNTSAAWTVANFNSAELGVQSRAA